MLRSVPRTVTGSELPALLKKWNFFEREKHWTGEFPNDFVDQTLTVFDRTTGLAWMKTANNDFRDCPEIRLRIREFNRERYAGYCDWRLPTLEEAMSLLSCTRRPDNFFIDPLFPAFPSVRNERLTAFALITADYAHYDPESLRHTCVWGVDFFNAVLQDFYSCDFFEPGHHYCHIRPCRSQAAPPGLPHRPAGAALPPPAVPRNGAKLPLPPAGSPEQLLRSESDEFPLLNCQPSDSPGGIDLRDIDAMLRVGSAEDDDEPPEIIILGDA
jgi:hypothetical protein